MEKQTNTKRIDFTFQPGDLVLLKLQPYRQHSVTRRASQKLVQRYFGPFKIIKRVGQVAYMLDLPSSSRIHPVFHVSLLKPYYGGAVPSQASPFPITTAGSVISSALSNGPEKSAHHKPLDISSMENQRNEQLVPMETSDRTCKKPSGMFSKGFENVFLKPHGEKWNKKKELFGNSVGEEVTTSTKNPQVKHLTEFIHNPRDSVPLATVPSSTVPIWFPTQLITPHVAQDGVVKLASFPSSQVDPVPNNSSSQWTGHLSSSLGPSIPPTAQLPTSTYDIPIMNLEDNVLFGPWSIDKKQVRPNREKKKPKWLQDYY